MGRPRLFDPDAAIGKALDLFWKQGYGATTPAELLDAIGIAKGSFYNTFESKHAIFEQALRRYGNDRVSGLASMLAGSGAAPVRDRIKGYFERLAAPGNAARLSRGCFAANTAAELGHGDATASAIVCDTFERMERVLEGTVKEGQARGELDSGLDPKAVASLLLAALVGITVLAKVDEPRRRAKRIALALAALL
jgi:TetR/AcrR family transcriptional repressor of nem operon